MSQMHRLALSLCLIVMAGFTHAQSPPALVLDNALSARFDTVHVAMNNLVKAFGKNPNKTSEYRTKYQTDLKIGKAFVYLSEDKEHENLKVNFSSIYYSGTNEQFIRFYNDVVKRFGEMLSATHTLQPQKTRPESYQSIFYENGTNVMNSPTSVYIDYSTISGKFPSVVLNIYKRKG